MKYSQLISFNPIEDVIQLVTAENKDKAREYVKTYVMSDSMAEALQAPMIDQLQMDEVVDNKGVLVVGNYGTGKSHLMSVISAVATDADNVQYLQNEKFKQQVQPIAGKFEVLRIEIGGVVMPLYDVPRLFDWAKAGSTSFIITAWYAAMRKPFSVTAFMSCRCVI